MNAALDRLEEILGSPDSFDLVKMQRGTKWLGLLVPMEDFEIYGYVTPSSTKVLALVQRESVIPLEKRKDTNIRVLCVSDTVVATGCSSCNAVPLITRGSGVYPYYYHHFIIILQANVHEAYIRYTMNPFTKVRSKIEKPCTNFERQVRAAVQNYTESILPKTTGSS